MPSIAEEERLDCGSDEREVISAMSPDELNPAVGAKNDGRFRTTHWSVVLAAGEQLGGDAETALAELCQSYWLPVYVYVRRHVARPGDAEDLTQEFFCRLLEKHFLAHVDRDRGRFRTFLVTAVQRFLANERMKSLAQKRGGGRRILSLDFAWAESQCGHEPANRTTPEGEFDRQWALRVLDICCQRLQEEYSRSGKSPLFERLKPLMTRSDDAVECQTAADELGMTAGAVKTAVYRMRRRYREILRAEIAHTLSPGEDVDDEVRKLFEALG